MEALLQKTAWQFQQTPKPYGAFYFTFLLIFLPLSLFLAWKLRNISETKCRWIVFSVGALLGITEIYKQLFLFFAVNNHSYDWWYFPFQLCSIPMYICLFLPFLKKGVLSEGLYSFLCYYNLLAAVMALLVPDGLLHSYVTLTIHSLFWHLLQFFLGFFLIFYKKGKSSAKNFLHATCIFLSTALTAICLNVIFSPLCDGNIELFYLNPLRPTNQYVFHEIALSIGTIPCMILYCAAICFGAWLIRHYVQKISHCF